MVFRLTCALLAALVFLTACRDQLKTKEKVNEAVLERLKAHSGLDLKALDVTTTDVNFEKNTAIATVSFRPKGDASLNGGMTMKYNLEARDGKWVVTGVNNSNGTAIGSHPSVTPPGHAMGAPGTAQLPAGHPSIPQSQKQ